MTEIKKKEKEKGNCVYVPPKIEVYETAPDRLLGTSFYTDQHNPGDGKDGDSDHHGGSDGGVEYGAKTVILGQEFSFSDLWEE